MTVQILSHAPPQESKFRSPFVETATTVQGVMLLRSALGHLALYCQMPNTRPVSSLHPPAYQRTLH